MNLQLPESVEQEAAAETLILSQEVENYLSLVEMAAASGTDASLVQDQGLAEIVQQARTAIAIVSKVLCTDDPEYANIRKVVNDDIGPLVDVVVTFLVSSYVQDETARALAFGAIRTAKRTLHHHFCSATKSLREKV
ncbi:MAG: hypothetical protein AAFU34_17060 [Pseudomonadota bacterium]